jgi:hypothetical protein
LQQDDQAGWPSAKRSAFAPSPASSAELMPTPLLVMDVSALDLALVRSKPSASWLETSKS